MSCSRNEQAPHSKAGPALDHNVPIALQKDTPLAAIPRKCLLTVEVAANHPVVRKVR